MTKYILMSGVFVYAVLPSLTFAVEIVNGGSEPNRVDLSRESATRAQSMQKLLHTPNASFGPNCWNAALLVSGLTDSIHYTSPAEFWHWMNSPFCKIVPGNEALRYGDIGSVFSSGGDHYHSFMRIDDRTIFQKAGPKTKQKWEITNYEKIVFPQFFSEAQKCRGTEAHQESTECQLHVTYSRCQPIPTDFYARYSELKTTETEIKAAETLMQPWIQHHAPKEQRNFVTAVARLKAIFKKLDGMRFFGEKEFARKALQFRVAGLMTTDVNAKLAGSTNQGAVSNAASFNDFDLPNGKSFDTLDRSSWRAFVGPTANSSNRFSPLNLRHQPIEYLSH